MSNTRLLPVAAGVLLILSCLPLPHTVRDALGALTLVAIAVAAWDPRVALAVLIAYLPLRIFVESMAPTPITFIPDTVVVVLAARVLYRHPDEIMPVDAIEVLAVLFGLWGLLATVHAHQHLSAAALEARDLLLFVVLYAAVRRLYRVGDGIDANWWWRIVPLALASIALVGLQGIAQTFLLGHALLLPGKLALQQAHVSTVNTGRPYGWLDNPNLFGELGLVALAITFALFRRRAYRPGWLFGLAACLFAAMLVLSFSRSAYIVFLVAAAIFAYGSRARLERVGIGLAVVVVLASIVVIPGARARTLGFNTSFLSAHGRLHGKTVTGKGGTAKGGATSHGRTTTKKPKVKPCRTYVCKSEQAGRLHNLRTALHIVRHHPLGTGMGTFGSAGAKVFKIKLVGVPKNFYADNQYLVVLVETGLPGTLLFLLLGVAAFWTLARRDADPDNRRLALILLLAVVILGAFSNAWEQLELAVYPWLGLAVLLLPGPSIGQRRAFELPQAAAALDGNGITP